jgi:hypothetical protein
MRQCFLNFDLKIHQKNKRQHHGTQPRSIFTKIDQHIPYRHTTRRQTPSPSQLLAAQHLSQATKERPGPMSHTAGPLQRIARTVDAARRKGQPQTFAAKKTFEIPHRADNLCNQTTNKTVQHIPTQIPHLPSNPHPPLMRMHVCISLRYRHIERPH